MGIQLGYGSNGQITFGLGQEIARNSWASYATGVDAAPALVNGMSAHAVGDINGDGREDFIARDSGITGVFVYLANSDGTLTSGAGFPDGTLLFNDFELSDINSDGKLDMVAATDQGIRTYLGSGSGTFSSSAILSSGTSYSGVELGDSNGDGKLDIFGLRSTLTSVDTYLGTNPNSWSLSATSTISSSNELATGDFNGDGLTDLVARSNTTLTILNAAASGQFSIAQTVSVTSNFGIGVGDFNHDGLSDVVYNSTGSIRLLSGTSNGTLNTSPTTLATATAGTRISVLDLNSDGLEDIGYVGASGASSLFSNGQGSFTQGLPKSIGSSELAYADINGDGVKDTIEDDTNNSGNFITYTANTQRTTNLQYVDLTTVQGAREALSFLESALADLSKELGLLGAAQSRLASATETLSSSRENFLSAESRIRDADVATESTNLIKNQILQQTASALLGQANQAPSLAIQLLTDI